MSKIVTDFICQRIRADIAKCDAEGVEVAEQWGDGPKHFTDHLCMRGFRSKQIDALNQILEVQACRESA